MAYTKKKTSRKGKSNVRSNAKWDKEASKIEATSKGSNPFEFYNKYPELAESAGRIPFAKVPGVRMPHPNMHVLEDDGTEATCSYLVTQIPSFAALKFYPSVGFSTASDSNSPINVAAKNIYARIRAKYSGALEADSPDIMMYIIAVDSLQMFIAHCKRIYGVLNNYQPMNAGMPRQLLNVMGLSDAAIDDLIKNKTAFWGYINTLSHMVNSFDVPNVMPIFDRHRFMCENVYLDAPSVKAQGYVFVPKGFYKIGTDSSTGTKLTMIDFTPSNYDSFVTMGNSLYKALHDMDDSYTINGYLQRAYEGVPTVNLGAFEESYKIDPIYNKEFIDQIQNATINVLHAADMAITQDVSSNNIVHTPRYDISDYSRAFYWSDDIPVNINSDVTDVKTVIEATRLTHYGKKVVEDDVTFFEVHGGTELISSIDVLENEQSSTITFNANVIDGGSTSNNEKLKMTYLRAFAGFPIIYSYWKTNNDFRWFANFDIWNFATVGVETLDDVTRVCIYSEFNSFDPI